MEREEFQKLLVIREELILSRKYGEAQIAYPFVPYVGTSYGKDLSFPRLMFVGKATHGFYGADQVPKPRFEDQENCTTTIVDTMSSAFWRFFVSIGQVIAQRSLEAPTNSLIDREWVMDRIVWNNVMKLGAAPTGNPMGPLAGAQREICKRIFASEISKFDPKIIIVLAGNYETELLKQVFGGRETWDISEGIGMWSKRSDSGRYIFWTMHPMMKTDQQLQEWSLAIEGYLSS